MWWVVEFADLKILSEVLIFIHCAVWPSLIFRRAELYCASTSPDRIGDNSRVQFVAEASKAHTSVAYFTLP